MGRPEEPMKAVIFWIPVANPLDFAWRWRAEDRTNESAESFRRYEDCAADARAHGYGGAAQVHGTSHGLMT